MSDWIGLINDIAASWSSGMWMILWQSMALAGIVGMLTLALRKAPAALRFWLWMLVPMRLMVMPLLTVSLPLLPASAMNVTSVAASPVVVVDAVPARRLPTAMPLDTSGIEPIDTGGSAAPAEAETIINNVPVIRLSIYAWLLAAWLAGVVLFILRLIKGWRRVRHLIAQAAPVCDSKVLQVAREAAERIGLRRVPEIVVSAANISPLVAGVFHPVVVLPESLVRRVCSGELLAVLSHEFAHLRRRDPLIGWLLGMCEALYFFHPAFHIAKRQSMREREQACDESVLINGRAQPGAYAEALITAAETCRALGCRITPAVVVAESFGDLKKRITLICSAIRPRAKMSKVSLTALVLFAILCLPGIVLTARSASEKSDTATGSDQLVTVTVAGKVTDAKSGKPIANALVRGHIVIWRHRGPDMFEKCPNQQIRTDADGVYKLNFETSLTVTGPMKGKDGLCVYASMPGYETRPIYVDPNVTSDKTDYTDVDFALVVGKRVKGTVVDGDNKPVANARVTVQNGWNGDWNYFGALGRANTNNKGEFEVWCSTDEQKIISGDPWLRISKQGYGTGFYWDLLKKDLMGTLVLPQGGTVVGRVVDMSSKPVADCEVSVRDLFDWVVDKTSTDKNGRYELKGIPGDPGLIAFYKRKNKSYMDLWGRMKLYARSDPAMNLQDVAQDEFSAQEGKTITRPDLVVDADTHVSGRLLASKTAFGLKGLMVRLDYSWDNMVEADVEGSFQFPHVRPGKHRLTAYLPHNLRGDRGVGHVDIDVKPGEPIEGVIIQLETLAEVRVQFADETGNPLESITAGATWTKDGSGFWTEGTKSDKNGRAVLYLYPGEVQYIRGFDHAKRLLKAKDYQEVNPKAGQVIDNLRIIMVLQR